MEPQQQKQVSLDELIDMPEEQLRAISDGAKIESPAPPSSSIDALMDLSDDELGLVASGQEMPKGIVEKALEFGGKAAGLANKAFEKIERYGNAPLRAGADELLRTENEFGKQKIGGDVTAAGRVGQVVAGLAYPAGFLTVPKFGERTARAGEAVATQFGRDPNLAPSGARIAEKRFGMSDEKYLPLGKAVIYGSIPGQTLEMISTITNKPSLTKGIKDVKVSPADVVGFGIEGALDATDLIPVGKVAGVFARGTKKGVTKLFPALKLADNADEVIQASKALGLKPTAGQIIDSKYVKNLESSLARTTDTIGGYKLRKTIVENEKVAREVAESLISDATTLTAGQTGELAGKQLTEALSDAIKPAEAIYNKYDEAFKAIKVKPNNKTVSNAIAGVLDDAYDPAIEAMAKKAQSRLEKVETVEDLKNMRTWLGGELRDTIDPKQKRAIGKIYGALTEARTESLQIAAKEFAKKSGLKDKKLTMQAAEKMIEEIKQADLIYRGAAQDLGSSIFAREKVQSGGLKAALENYINNTPEISLVKDLMDTNDYQKLREIKRVFPDAFESIRQQKIAQMAEKAGQIPGRSVDPRRLAKSIRQLPPETAEIIFGKDRVEKARALETFFNSLPPDFNPSGTSRGIQFFEQFTPQGIINQFSALSRSQLLELNKKIVSGVDPMTIIDDLTGAAVAGSIMTKPFKEDGLQLPTDRQPGLQIPGR